VGFTAGACWEVLWNDRCFRSVFPTSDDDDDDADSARSRLKPGGDIPGGDGRARDPSRAALTAFGVWSLRIELFVGDGAGPLAMLSLRDPVDGLELLLPRSGTASSAPPGVGKVSFKRLG